MEQRKGYLTRWRGLGRIEKAFLVLVVLYAFLYATRLVPGLRGVVVLAMALTGLILLLKLARRGMRTAIWRLRNRLVIAYLFIAVVPLVLVLTLVMLGVWVVIGTMAVYLVNTELTHREDLLRRQAELIARLPVQETQLIDRFVTTTRNLFPNCELRITGAQGEMVYPADSKLTHPPKEWKRADGLITKGTGADKRLYVWAHEVPQTGNGGREQAAFGPERNALPIPPPKSTPVPRPGRRPPGPVLFGRGGLGRPGPSANNEVTIVVPVTHERLAKLVPDIGDVSFTNLMGHLRTSHVPPPANFLDLGLTGAYPMEVPAWESPGSKTGVLMTVDTRLSAVLGIVFGQRQASEYGSIMFTVFIVVSVLFLIVELASLVAGISLSRTITGAVHEMYRGTQHVKEGDFSYRIPVKGNDQLAEMCTSFNTMAENLGRLIVVAKEKERLESELAIAREVQNQLFPKDVPGTKTLELKGVCRPARMVSGDYYDFISLSDESLAFAIGDVAGKGISAALLMATIQSTMRTQLGAQNGGTRLHLSTAAMVANLNKQLYATTAPEKYATFYFALYDEPTHTLTYTNAGHLSPLLLRGSSVETLDSTGTVVGAFPFARYEEKTVALEQGDVLVAYTDGIVEPENAYGEMFGDERLHELLFKYERADSSEMIARTMEAVTQWTGSSELQDDMTMVVARRI
jgi:sigma-B regulation protein RsbU (phosphoserine phosphatase)